MADAVRQPRPFLAQTAAWLGVITADMPMQNCASSTARLALVPRALITRFRLPAGYVYNHIMYARWVLEDATSALNGQIAELSPSLLAPVTTVHPEVTVVEGDAWIRARAWRDAAFEAQQPGQLCVHLAVASIGATPGNFAIKLDGVCGGNGEPPCPKRGLNATHLFQQFYAVKVVEKQGSTSLFVNDMLAPGQTAVYALGCEAWVLGGGALGDRNLVNDPGFEDTELPLTPGFITCVRLLKAHPLAVDLQSSD